MSSTFEIVKAPARIESVTFARSKPKSDTDSGAAVKRLKLWLDVTDKGAWARVVPLFPGAVDEHTLHRVASEGGPGFDVRSKRKLGASNVRVHDPQGGMLFESQTSRVDRPRLVIGKEAKTSWLVLDVEIAIPKGKLSAVDEYFKADVLASVANSQLDLEDEAAAKAKVDGKREALAEKGAKKKGAKKKGVEWIPPNGAQGAPATG